MGILAVNLKGISGGESGTAFRAPNLRNASLFGIVPVFVAGAVI